MEEQRKWTDQLEENILQVNLKTEAGIINLPEEVQGILRDHIQGLKDLRTKIVIEVPVRATEEVVLPRALQEEVILRKVHIDPLGLQEVQADLLTHRGPVAEVRVVSGHRGPVAGVQVVMVHLIHRVEAVHLLVGVVVVDQVRQEENKLKDLIYI